MPAEARAPLEVIPSRGCLARRIATAIGPTIRRERLVDVYRRLEECLARGESFEGA